MTTAIRRRVARLEQSLDRTQARDEVFAAKILDTCSHGDTEGVHSAADGILIDLLTQLGYVETVKAWQSVDKWYA